MNSKVKKFLNKRICYEIINLPGIIVSAVMCVITVGISIWSSSTKTETILFGIVSLLLTLVLSEMVSFYLHLYNMQKEQKNSFELINGLIKGLSEYDRLNNLQNDEITLNKLYKNSMCYIQESAVKFGKTNKLFKYSYNPDLKFYEKICTVLFNNFNGKKENDFFYATAKCDQETLDWFFNPNQISSIFLPKLHEALIQEKITSFKRLFLYSKKMELENPYFIYLFLLHKEFSDCLAKKNISFKMKFLRVDQFRHVADAYSNVELDIGVWGNHCVYINGKDDTKNGYSFDPDTIGDHKKLFNDAWADAEDAADVVNTADMVKCLNVSEIKDDKTQYVVECIQQKYLKYDGIKVIKPHRIDDKLVADMNLNDIQAIQNKLGSLK